MGKVDLAIELAILADAIIATIFVAWQSIGLYWDWPPALLIVWSIVFFIGLAVIGVCYLLLELFIDIGRSI